MVEENEKESEKKLVLGIYALSPLHPGSGTYINSPVDLPIQRERHTNFPVIYGQGLKGVLRNAYRRLKNDIEKEESIFGPRPENSREKSFSSAITICDAKILLFPVRSLKGVFAYVTCPKVIERFFIDLYYSGLIKEELSSLLKKVPVINEDEIIVESESSLCVSSTDDKSKEQAKVVVLEDVVLKVKGDTTKLLNDFIPYVRNLLPADIIADKRFAVVSNDLFEQFVTMATEINARIKINYDTGVVETGALWYEEDLPSDTLLYSLIIIGRPKKENETIKTAEDIANELKKNFNEKLVQIGGDETVGKGLCVLKFWEGEKK